VGCLITATQLSTLQLKTFSHRCQTLMQTAAPNNTPCLGRDKRTETKERGRKCLPPMQVSLQPKHSLADMEMKA
jgi:hypothetical protein